MRMADDKSTTPVAARFTAAELALLDADAAKREKTRAAWLHDLAVAMLDGRLVMAPTRRTTSSAAPTASQRVRREYSKAQQASGKGNRTG
jgi:hypothetical protein